MNLRTLPLSLLLVSTAFALPPQAPWKTFIDESGKYKITYPPQWQVLTKGSAVVITSPGGAEDRGVFGITPRPAGSSIEESVQKEFDDPDHASDLAQAPARIGGIPAIKVWGSKKGDSNIRIVEYYVQKGKVQYYILFQAPHTSMDRFGGIFNKMIGSMKFLQ